jgi:hypothetical protein
MPIRKDLRRFYMRDSGWPAVRRRILERAGGKFDAGGKYVGGAKCEQCGVADRQQVERAANGVWRSLLGGKWRSSDGGLAASQIISWLNHRYVRTVLTVAHLNHIPGDDRDENLKALCQWCHLNRDRLHHKETRSVRKDAARPLLKED